MIVRVDEKRMSDRPKWYEGGDISSLLLLLYTGGRKIMLK